MYPDAYKLLNSFWPSMQKPHIKFMWESTFEGPAGLTLGILFTPITIFTPLIFHGVPKNNLLLSTPISHVLQNIVSQKLPIDIKTIIPNPMGTFKEHLICTTWHSKMGKQWNKGRLLRLHHTLSFFAEKSASQHLSLLRQFPGNWEFNGQLYVEFYAMVIFEV